MYKIGSDIGNSGAIIRWGKYLDNGIWMRKWRFKKIWFKWKMKKRYTDLGIFVIQWGN